MSYLSLHGSICHNCSCQRRRNPPKRSSLSLITAATTSATSTTPLSFLSVPTLPFSSQRVALYASPCHFVSSRRRPFTVTMAAARRKTKPKEPSTESSKSKASQSFDESKVVQFSVDAEDNTEDNLVSNSENFDDDPAWLFGNAEENGDDDDNDAGDIPNFEGDVNDNGATSILHNSNSSNLISDTSQFDENIDDDDDDDSEEDSDLSLFGSLSDGEEDDDDDDDDDDDGVNDDVDEEDDEISALEEADEDDDDEFESEVEPISSLDSQRSFRPSSGRAPLLDEPDENDDDIEDVEDLLDPLDGAVNYADESLNENEGEEEVEGDESDVLLEKDDDDDDEAILSRGDGDDEDDPDLDEFGAESEEDIKSAADILSERGLLGLGVEKDGRQDVASVRKFALDVEDDDDDEDEEQDVDTVAEGINSSSTFKSAPSSARKSVKSEEVSLPDMLDESEDEIDSELSDEDDEDGMLEEDDEEDDLDYPDAEDDEDGEIGLTRQAKFGRIWDLNEDSYISITEPGESYGYELDMEDQEDQDMASMRRGKQGGWSGGLASYPSSDLQEGSREWIARRSYELMTKASYKDMFHWAKWHEGPPPAIAALYPDDPPPSTPLGKSILKMSSPPPPVTLIGRSSEENVDGYMDDDIVDEGSKNDSEINHHHDGDDAENGDGQLGNDWKLSDRGERPDLDIVGDGKEDDEENDGFEEYNSALLERSIKFPSKYKFKVEGVKDKEFVPSVRETTEQILGKNVPRSAFTTEPAGRHQRVTILVEVESARQVTELYDALRNNSYVKFSYG